jgi:ERCC4-type nuclease
MHLATILRDRRERRPWAFRPHPVSTRDVTLSTGDYTLASCCSRDPETGTHDPRYAVERKTGGDFLTAITHDRERFRAELERASSWRAPLSVVVEEPWRTFAENRGVMRRREIHPEQVAGTLSAWSEQYNVEFRFLGSRRAGELYALCRLLRVEVDPGSPDAALLRRKLASLHVLVVAQTGAIEEVGLSVAESPGEER